MATISNGRSYFNKDAPEMVIRSIFTKYDKDGSGSLEKAELMTMLKDDFGLKNDQAANYILLLDKDGNGSLSKEEFVQWMRSEEKFRNIDDSTRYHRLVKAVQQFKKHDQDGSGVIERDEFTTLMLSMGHNRKDIDSALMQLDSNGDGKISFPEFLVWLNWLPN